MAFWRRLRVGEYIRVRLRLGPALVVSPRSDDLRPNDRKPTTKTAELKPKKKPSILQIIDGYTAKPADKRRQATGRPTNARPTVGALMNSRELITKHCKHCLFRISSNTSSRRHVVTSCCVLRRQAVGSDRRTGLSVLWGQFKHKKTSDGLSAVGRFLACSAGV